MGNYFLSILLIIGGLLFFIMTLIDEKNRDKALTTSYVMHLKGYLGGIGLFLMGIIMLYRCFFN
ncbi:hypothetical protein [Myroides fluvii]|uniref:hypothetical protein n=1 Tax=Myroides fluvii TaxID=2572594 RepID=UPI00131E5602|nr:hypothetical protein [Myroides fluvii]